MAVGKASKRSRTTGKSTARRAVRRTSRSKREPRLWHGRDPFDRDVMFARMQGLQTLQRTNLVGYGVSAKELEFRGFLSIMHPEYSEQEIHQMAREMARDE